MLIGELAERTGTTPRTLRFYEERGLLVPDRTPTGYRRYPPEAESRVRHIRELLALGFTIADLQDLLGYLDLDIPDQFGPSPRCTEGLVIGEARVAALSARIDGLTKLRDELVRKMPWLAVASA